MRNGGEENTPGRPKSDDFGRAVSRMAVAQICERVGFDGFKKSALDSLSDITIQYLSDLGKTASFYANLSGRTRCHFFDIARSFEDILIGVSQGFLGASSSDNCLVNSGTIKELIDFVGSTDEIPFVQLVPRFPIIRDRKLIPTFEKMSEVPPGKHIPAWLPALPDPHTYLHTPMWNERLLDPRAEKVEQARQRIKAERALLSLQKRKLSNGSAGASSSGISDNVKEPGTVYSSQFLAMPLESGKKDVSPAVLSDELKTHFSVMQAFAPAIEAAKEGGICDAGDIERKTLSEKRPAVIFKFKTGKKLYVESLDLSLSKKGGGRTGHWLGRGDERDDKKRRAEYILRQSMENPQELTQL
ncbi:TRANSCRIPTION INITIATION FACTOR TFIID SUBUNIT 8 [Salix purpurea]|uniref:Transcription initiation factor TFIID subunit 8 n=1 Tax=Salix purpurea TaxID=77065 RepID=A0A9Q0VW56_SALPP|nr:TRANSCRIPTION INITIATION FACTOR TFIID SUBUNIT 8 [Salix purpurea]